MAKGTNGLYGMRPTHAAIMLIPHRVAKHAVPCPRLVRPPPVPCGPNLARCCPHMPWRSPNQSSACLPHLPGNLPPPPSRAYKHPQPTPAGKRTR
eukprot:317303-Chlamydomonas_euryale.AAC.2